MSKLTKNQKLALGKIEAGKTYSLKEASALVKEITTTKFDASVDVDVRLGVDPRKANQMVRGVVSLPHGTGKQIRVLALCTPDKEAEATAAGADGLMIEVHNNPPAALCDGERLLAEYTLNNGNTHSETLLPMVEAILSAFAMKPHDVDLFACSAGPGSFTGVRIGVATVKGLAFGSGRPAVGVSTLEALARNLDHGDPAEEKVMPKIICPVMDARRGQLYTARFIRRGDGLERLTPDRAISYTEFESETLPLGKVWLCGDGYGLVHGLMPEGSAFDTPERLRYQSAYSVAMAALAAYNRGDYGKADTLSPVYLRLSQAERERAERLARESENK